MVPIGAGVTHTVAGVGSVNLGQVVNLGVENVHLLHQTSERRLCGFADFLVHTLRLNARQTFKFIFYP